MNLEAINKWLDEEYGCSYTRLEELHDFYFKKYCDLKKENKKLKEALANNGIVSTCENCETFGICPHSYREYDYKYECDKLKQEMNKVAIQQKEFIKYLEGEIKTTQIKWGDKLTENGYIDIAMTVRAYQIILQKYKEIIGSDSNVKK